VKRGANNKNSGVNSERGRSKNRLLFYLYCFRFGLNFFCLFRFACYYEFRPVDLFYGGRFDDESVAKFVDSIPKWIMLMKSKMDVG